MEKNNAAPNFSEPRSNTRITENDTTYRNNVARQAKGKRNNKKPKRNGSPFNRKTRALKLAADGYDIIPLRGGKAAKQPQKSGWAKAPQIAPEDIESDKGIQWHGIGLRTENFPTIDIDITDSELSRQVVDFVRETLGKIAPKGRVLLRYGMKPKVAILCRLKGESFNKKVTMSVSSETSGDHTSNRAAQKVEILGNGQHVVVDGNHAKTRHPYEWHCESNGLLSNGLAGVSSEELPELTKEAAATLIKGINDIIQAWMKDNGAQTVSNTNYDALSHNSDSLDFVVHVAEFKKSSEAEQRATMKHLKIACEHLRECNYLDNRDNWVSTGHALASLKETGHDQELESIWLNVCTWEDAQEDGQERWRTFNPKQVNSTSYRTIFKRAKEHGWVNPLSTQEIPLGYILRKDGDLYGFSDDTSKAKTDGVYKLKGGKALDFSLCNPLWVVARTSGLDSSESHGQLIEFIDSNGNRHVKAIPYQLITEPSDFSKVMGGTGLNIGPNRSKDVCEYLHKFGSIVGSQPPVPVSESTGWNGEENNFFVLPPDQSGKVNTVSRDDNEHGVYLQSVTPPSPVISISGAVSDWQRTIAKYCTGNPALMLAIGVAFAAPTLHLLKQNSGGFHLHGSSSQGKTTLLQVARSVYGSKDTLNTWRATDNALENTAERYNDLLLTLDEISQADADTVKNVTYMIANGQGKQRLNADASSKTTKKWRVLVLSTGEKTPEEIVNASNKVNGDLNAGQHVRFPCVCVDGFKHGVFEHLHECEGGKQLSEHLSSAANDAYGAIGYKWLNYLVKNSEEATKQLSLYKQWFEAEYPAENDQHRRVIQRFAIVAAALQYAVDCDLLKFNKTHIVEMINRCVTLYLEQFEGQHGLSEDEQILTKIRTAIEKHAGNRIENLSDLSSKGPQDRIGYMYRDDGKPDTELHEFDDESGDAEQRPEEQTEYIYAFTKDELTALCGKQFSVKRIREALLGIGALKPSTDGYTHQVRKSRARREPKDKSRRYLITEAISRT